ncbi:MAG: hypothetical protein KatS3mg121_0640 [Gammaproteobacteria bacterium]|nr:MAG: hypothetical protein KatS3mg121_0640 [Gammaproteobacteria bacterium]
MARPYDRVEWRLEGPGFGPVTVSAEIVPAGEGGADLAHRLTRPHAGPPWRRLAGWWAARRELAFAEDALVGLARAAERLPPPVERELVAETVRYRAGEVELRGHLVYDAHLRRAPAVLVVHEWWGQNDYARLRAHMLAELGYVALAVDMYGEGRLAEHPDEAGRFAGAVLQNRERARARFEAALDFLRGHPKVDPERIAAIGYCFGGAVVLAMVREGLDLDLAASFHGGLPPGAEQGAGAGFAGRVLVFHGGADPLVDGEAMRRFVDDLRTRGVRAEFVEYPGAKHGFSNPDADDLGERFGLPLAYDIEADQDSWRRLSAALAEVFSAP